MSWKSASSLLLRQPSSVAYPEINAFITKLSEKQPRRQLTKYIADFDEKDYYNIDQLAKITTDRLSGPEFGMTSGNAEFLLDAVNAEIKKINRLRGKKHTWYCPFILFLSYSNLTFILSTLLVDTLGFTLILRILAICNPYFRYPYTYIHSLKYIFTELLYISRMMKPTPTIWFFDLVKSMIKKHVWFHFISCLNDVPELMPMSADIVLEKWKALFNRVQVWRIWR